MTADLLRLTGEALYGPRWQSELARAVGVSDRTMRRWAASGEGMPGDLMDRLRALCAKRVAAIRAMARELRGS